MKKNMSMRARVTAVVVLLVATALSGCAVGAKDEPVKLAQVGDIEITDKEVNALAEMTLYIQGFDFSALDDENLEKQIRDSILEMIIDTDTLIKYYEGKNALPEDTEEKVQSFIDSAYETEGLRQTFEEKGVTEETMRFFAFAQYYDEAFIKEITEGGYPSEDDIAAYYAENMEDFAVEEIRASHILISDAEHTDENRKLIEEVREKIIKGETTFEEMAAEYNSDSTKDTGGDLNYFERGSMVPEFEEAAFALKTGEISGIVESEYGYHLIKVTDIREKSYKSLTDAEEDIRTILTGEIYETEIEKLREETGVEYLTQ
ncbi:MAG: peptidylprolyl isomerase [Clostridiales Family XIII bacterium]|jgi:foldase protein PrsA|nr:peptidylprolyl isomerase [Clostridiales Family XIII bacterium]